MKNIFAELKMYGAAKDFDSLLTRNLTNENFLQALLKAELDSRKSRQTKRKIGRAHFPYEKEWVEIDSKKNVEIEFDKIVKYTKSDFIP